MRTSPLCELIKYAAVAVFLITFLSGGSSAQVSDLGTVLESMRTGKYQNAIEIAQQQVEKKTWNEAWPRLLATNYMTIGKYAEALEVFKASQERFSDSLRLKLLGYQILLANNLPSEARAVLDDLTTQIQRSPWKYSTKSELVPLGEFFLLQGEEPKQVLKLCYDQSLKSDPKNIEALKAIASMAVDKSDTKVAADALDKALKISPTDPDLWSLAGEAWSSVDRSKSRESLQTALDINPNHIPSLLLVAESLLDSESYPQAIEILEKIEAINPHHPQMWALRAAVAHLVGAYSDEGDFRSKALELRKLNPIVDHKIGKHLSLHYRFAEGAQYQQRALSMDSKFHPAQTQLAQDLLRLGRESEGWDMVAQARKGDPYHVTSYNLQLLKEQLDKYTTIEAPGFIIRMEATEAKVFGTQVAKVLGQARDVLVEKYQAKLNEPIVVELFAKQRDFAVRTFGLPGGEGFLGVCFGNVITANSPSALDVEHNWQSVLWHEYCHVITLSLTSNRMPRWLSEGISVYEEQMHRSNWGEPPNPIYVHWLRSGEFEPPSSMSRMFLAPKSPMHLQFAYYVASLVVEFWVDQFGHDGLLKLLSDLRDGLPIAEAISRRSGSFEGLDQAFLKYAKNKAQRIAESLDFEPIPKEQIWSNWLDLHPQSYFALHKKLDEQMRNKDWQEGMKLAQQIQDAWPADPSETSALGKLSKIHRELGDMQSYRRALEQRVGIDPHATEPLKELIAIDRKAQDWTAVSDWSKRLLEIQPMQYATLEELANASEVLLNPLDAISSLESLSQLDPLDPAEVHFRLARAYLQNQQRDAALRHCLEALEDTPRYSAALELLLTLQANESSK